MQFPAAVALLVILFFALLLCDWVVGDRKTRAVVNIIDVPVCVFWCCKYLSSNCLLRLVGLFVISVFFSLPREFSQNSLEFGCSEIILDSFSCL